MDVVFSRGGLLSLVNWHAYERAMQSLTDGLSHEFVLLLDGIAGPLYGPGASQHKDAYASFERASSIAMEAVLDDYFRINPFDSRHPQGIIDACSQWIGGRYGCQLGDTSAVKIRAMLTPLERAYVLARYAPPLGCIRFLQEAKPAVSFAQGGGDGRG